MQAACVCVCIQSWKTLQVLWATAQGPRKPCSSSPASLGRLMKFARKAIPDGAWQTKKLNRHEMGGFELCGFCGF